MPAAQSQRTPSSHLRTHPPSATHWQAESRTKVRLSSIGGWSEGCRGCIVVREVDVRLPGKGNSNTHGAFERRGNNLNDLKDVCIEYGSS